MWVSTEPTAEDKIFIQRIFSEYGDRNILPPTGYAKELEIIAAACAAIALCAPLRVAIESGGPREPKNLYEQRKGLCFDLSRSIEKGLRSVDFQVRHISVFSRVPGNMRLKSLLLPSRTRPEQREMPGYIDSHALCEVRTEKGWIAVDSLSPWMSLGDQGIPISLRRLQRAVIGGGFLKLDPDQERLTPNILCRPFSMVYGLYSRHGRFYPPFLPYPNVNLPEFLANFSIDS